MAHSSRLEGFYKYSLESRREQLADRLGLSSDELAALTDGGLTLEEADRLIENAVGVYGLPFGIAANFTINSKDYLVPMVIEEPSVVAACSHAAKIVRACGGFAASADEPLLVGQIQVLDAAPDAAARILAAQGELLALANGTHPNLVQRGGGAREITVRALPATRAGAMLIVQLALDTRDAMGANLVNTACEQLAPRIAAITGGRVNLRILSNLADKRLARASCRITRDALGDELVRDLIAAQVMAEVDPYRAATHNKGVLNGIDALALATGNDWRALEAGAHAYAARSGAYRALTEWTRDANGDLHGALELPLAVGIVGGMTKAHRGAQVALRILGVKSGQELAVVMAAVGLAQNFAALHALAGEGIQHGHMKLHARRKGNRETGK